MQGLDVSAVRSRVVLLCAVTAWSASALAVVDLTPVVVENQTVPGDPTRGFYVPASTHSGLNNSRKVAFWTFWDSSDQFPENGQFTWQNGVVTDVLRSNDVANAPGIGQPVVQTQPGYMDHNGTLAVPASFGVDQEDVNYVGPNRAGLALVNRTNGANAPGNPNPWAPFIGVKGINNGHMSFYGREGNDDLGLWVGTSAATLKRLAQASVTLVPGTALPMTDLSFETPFLNSSGLTMFEAGYGPGNDEKAIVMGTNDADLQVVARTNNTDVPGLPGGTKFSRLFKQSLNNAGHAVIRGGWGNGSGTSGGFTTARGILEPVALGGITPVPGMPGEVIDSDGPSRLTISGNDKIFFTAAVNTFFDDGLFKWDNGVLSTLAFKGQMAPGATAAFDYFQDIHTNASGDLLFVAQLENDQEGIWYLPAGSSSPILQLITGEMVDIFGDGSDIRAVDGMAMVQSYGGPQAGDLLRFNDNGDFIVALSFTPDVTGGDLDGLFISTVVLPEPATLGLFAATGIFLTRRRVRRDNEGSDFLSREVRRQE